MAPKVSFIIIAYNAAAHLDNILDDVKKQTFNHSLIEVILVDSNSTDNTAEKFYSFKENNDLMLRNDFLDGLAKKRHFPIVHP